MKNLRNCLIAKGITIKDFAKSLNISESSAQNKLQGKTEFTYSEIKIISNVILPEYKVSYLFNESA